MHGRSRDEVRSLGDGLLTRLSAITANDQANQVKCAAVLAAMNIAPVITIHLDFGRDNHNDEDFATESESQVVAIPLLGELVKELDLMKQQGILAHDVIVGSLNVFGRTLKRKMRGGRDHNSGHHVMVLMGNGLKGGIVGGIRKNTDNSEYIADTIDSTMGAAGGTDIPFEETLASAGKTLAYSLGMPEDRIGEMVDGGKIVKSAFA